MNGLLCNDNISDVVLEEVFNRACEVYPQDTARITRALNIVLDEEITDLGHKMYAVRSQTMGTTPQTYIIDRDVCMCLDSQTRPVVCKHRYATYLYQWTVRRMDHYAALDHQDYVNGNWERRNMEDERWVWAS